MKNIQFLLTIVVSDKISDDREIMEMANKIATALKNHVQHSEAGIVPDASEGITESIRVKPFFLDEEVQVNLP